MTTPAATPRPDAAKPLVPAPADDGLFGPDSITWKLTTAPAASVAITTAVLVQMLHPRVMWMINQASSFWQYPERRGQLTAQYGLTVGYGDTATAEHAGATLRTIHEHRTAIDPITGETYRASEPDLLLWVHCTIPWAILRGLRRWGPQLTPAEQDRYVAEQRTFARLVGIDPDKAPGSVAELDAYMESMRPKMALTDGCLRLLEMTVPRKVKPTQAGLLQWVSGQAALSLLTPEQRRLYGIRWTRLDETWTKTVVASLLGKAAAKLNAGELMPKLRTEAMEHPFGGPPRAKNTADAGVQPAPPRAAS